MSFRIDHVFILCDAGAPEGEALIAAGLTEGSSNTHPGQGTANRRFFFEDFFLELLWVSDPDEVRSEAVAPTRLWERWSGRGQGTSPFGLVFASAGGSPGLEPPFPTWPYHPPYSEVAIDVGAGMSLNEPALFYFRFSRRPGALRDEPRAHALSARTLTAVSVGIPGADPRSEAARAAESTGLVTFPAADDPVMTLAFDGEKLRPRLDLRPALPLVLAW